MARNDISNAASAEPSAGLPAFAVQDLAALRAQLDGINAAAGNVSASLTKAFGSASASGRAFNATLLTIAASLSQMLAGVGAGFLGQGLSSIFGGLFGGAAAQACRRRLSPTAASSRARPISAPADRSV